MTPRAIGALECPACRAGSVMCACCLEQSQCFAQRDEGSVEALTERHMASLVDAARVKSPYFRLLARDPDALEARTRTDKDIFYNPDAGLPRAERELAAAATSRFNGCLYCASVHARHAAIYSKRETDVQRC